MKITRVTDWFLRTHPSPCHGTRPCLGGKVAERSVCTSPIVDVKGRLVTTESGNVYRLEGTPDAIFTHVLEEKKLRFLKSAPLRPLQEAGHFSPPA